VLPCWTAKPVPLNALCHTTFFLFSHFSFKSFQAISHCFNPPQAYLFIYLFILTLGEINCIPSKLMMHICSCSLPAWEFAFPSYSSLAQVQQKQIPWGDRQHIYTLLMSCIFKILHATDCFICLLFFLNAHTYYIRRAGHTTPPDASNAVILIFGQCVIDIPRKKDRLCWETMIW